MALHSPQKGLMLLPSSLLAEQACPAVSTCMHPACSSFSSRSGCGISCKTAAGVCVHASGSRHHVKGQNYRVGSCATICHAVAAAPAVECADQLPH